VFWWLASRLQSRRQCVQTSGRSYVCFPHYFFFQFFFPLTSLFPTLLFSPSFISFPLIYFFASHFFLFPLTSLYFPSFFSSFPSILYSSPQDSFLSLFSLSSLFSLINLTFSSHFFLYFLFPLFPLSSLFFSSTTFPHFFETVTVECYPIIFG